MKFTATMLPGVFLVDIEAKEDERGFFARSFCREEFIAQGLAGDLVQCSVSWNRRKGTLRGMHYQAPPHEETKLVRCTSGAIHDVVVDLRNDSPTHHHWVAVELSAANRRALYVPFGCAHGFQTLSDDSEVFYQMSTFYHPESARGVRFDDPAFAIEWPLPNPIVSERDRAFALVR